MKIHGQPYYDQAISTLEWFLDNRLPEQRPMLHFIGDVNNIHELKDYIERWNGIYQRIFPLHRIHGVQLQSDNMPEINYWWDEAKQPNRPLIVHPNGKMELEYLRPYETCQGTWSFSIAWNGLLIHCTDISYKYNYGHVYEKDMLEVWHQRNRAKRTHEACLKCNVKNPDWERIMDGYGV